jgi:ATP-dependent protease HslVU (ClpYQ) peptidase subunit
VTTIATDGKSMAGDGNSTVDRGIVRRTYPKVDRLADGRLFGSCGDSCEGKAIADWLNAGADRVSYPALKDLGTQALVLNLDGTIDIYDSYSMGYPDRVDAPVAIGSGAAYAIGAMDAGASPLRAVELTALRDPFTGGANTELFVEGVN